MESSKSESPGNVARVFVSLGVVLAYFVGFALPLPGIQWGDMPGEGGLFDNILEYSNFSVGALGANPFTSAFITVEVAAFLVPPWRRLRNGSESGRKKLVRASLITTFVLVIAQGFAMSQTMQGMVPVSTGSVLGSYVVWAAVLLGLAHSADRFGALGGIPNLILAEFAFSLIKGTVVGSEVGSGLLFQLAALFFAMPVLTGRQWSGNVSANKGATLFPWLLAGVVPLQFAISSLGWPSLVDRFVDEESPVRSTTALLLEHPWWTLLILAGALFLLAPAFYKPSALRALDRLIGHGADSVQLENERFSRSRNLSLFYLTLIGGASLLAWSKGVSIDIGTPFVLVAVCLDGASSLRFWARHSDAVNIYQCHRVYHAVRIANALSAEGIEVHLSGLRHRSLLHFFAPYVPVGVLVPAADARAGQELLRSVIRDGMPSAEQDETGGKTAYSPPAQADRQSAVKRTPLSLLPGVWVLAALAAIAGAVSLLPPEPVWEPIPSGTMAIYEIDDSQSAFLPQELVSCEGVEVREQWVSSAGSQIHVAFARDLGVLQGCVDMVQLPKGTRLLFERDFEIPGTDPADEIRQKLVGWQTVLVHEEPAVTAEDLWGFTEREDGTLTVEFRDPALFGEVTGRNVEKRLAIVLMDEVVTTPRVNDRITSNQTVLNPYPTEEGFAPLLKRLRAKQE